MSISLGDLAPGDPRTTDWKAQGAPADKQDADISTIVEQ